METKTLRITPKTAKIMLKKNAVNRPLKKMTIEIYTRQMMRGLWREETGEAIKFRNRWISFGWTSIDSIAWLMLMWLSIFLLLTAWIKKF